MSTILALSVLALAINGTAAIYTSPAFEFTLPDFREYVAELIPHEKASTPVPDPVIIALRDIQSVQQQHHEQLAQLQESSSSLQQQNTALLQKDSTVLLGLRQSVTDEQTDIKKISSQLSTLMAKVDTLQNAIAPEITSSIPKGRARNRLSHKRVTRLSKPAGPVSVGGAPLTIAPAQGWDVSQSPEG